MTKNSAEGGICEYPVRPEDVAEALNQNMTFTTGLIPADLIYLDKRGAEITTASYRPPRRTGLWLEGTDTPVRIPLPGLLLITRNGAGQARHRLFAVKHKPASLDDLLFCAPLPNVNTDHSLCWGTVPQHKKEEGSNTDISSTWRRLLGSPFGSHSVDRRSRKFPEDVRRLYFDMEKRQLKRYPAGDLIPTKLTLGAAINL